MRIDFFIAGVQKGGTTALDVFLRQHSSIQMASIKEVHFFDDESTDWTAPDYGRLHGVFDWRAAHTVIRGEATPIYTYWPNSLERLHRYNPAAKIVVGFRHPSLRAFSHWRMEIKRSNDTRSFAEAIGERGRERVWHSPSGVHRVFSYVERGFYAAQVERLLHLFPRDQLFFFRSDRLWSGTAEVLNEIQDFLGVERQLAPERRYIVPMDARELGSIPVEQKQMLDSLFAQDIRALANLTGLDLQNWLDASYVDPTMA
jgi:Sulfotransferase domain